MMYAYCRVSTERQSLQRQIDNISAAFPEISPKCFYQDKFTGATQDRPAWNKLLQKVQSGDTIVFDSVSRMSRDAAEGAKQYEELYKMGISLIFLNEPHCNTDTYKTAAAASIPTTGNEIADIYIEATNRVLMILAKRQIMIAFEQSEKERKDICKRVKDGMKASGNMGGRKTGFTYESEKVTKAREIIREKSKDFGGQCTNEELMNITKISRDTFFKLKKQLKAEMSAKEST
jgi:DNA invertase Pin-like site-specific DNA recombinase